MRTNRHINWDALGITASVLCGIHCALLPLAVVALPVFVHYPAFEYGMILLAFLIGTWALWHGFHRHHHRLTPWLLFVAGMIFLISKEIWQKYELGLLPLAIGFIVVAHVVNYRLSRGGHAKTARPAQLSPVDGASSSSEANAA